VQVTVEAADLLAGRNRSALSSRLLPDIPGKPTSRVSAPDPGAGVQSVRRHEKPVELASPVISTTTHHRLPAPDPPDRRYYVTATN